MARARNIKPGFFKNEYLAELPMEARLLFIGLWCLADKDGRLEDRPKRIKAELFPFDNVDVDSLLELLATTHKGQDEPFVRRYSVGDADCLQIVKFAEHQRCHVNETSSGLPTYEESGNYPSTREKNRALGKSCNPLGQKCPSLLNDECGMMNDESPTPHNRLPSAAVSDVQAIVNHFQVQHPKSRPGAKERKLISDRLKEGFSVQDLCDAIDGMHKTPHNLGENDRSTTYLTIGIAMRDASQVTRFIENNHDPPARNGTKGSIDWSNF